MSWISDVKHDLSKLDLAEKSLRKFGYTVGAVLIALYVWFFYRNHFEVFRTVLLVVGFLLVLGGFLFPKQLKNVYKIWMGLAFVLGWLVSRIILTILFFLVITPIGLLAKLAGKKFVDSDINKDSKSYWIKRDSSKVQYEKMF
jgi:multisubunit Na+/H+ antiporter MnhG subunit